MGEGRKGRDEGKWMVGEGRETRYLFTIHPHNCQTCAIIIQQFVCNFGVRLMTRMSSKLSRIATEPMPTQATEADLCNSSRAIDFATREFATLVPSVVLFAILCTHYWIENYFDED